MEHVKRLTYQLFTVDSQSGHFPGFFFSVENSSSQMSLETPR